MERININDKLDNAFLREHGDEIDTVYIPTDANTICYNETLLSECPNITEFVNEGSNSFEYKDGILYAYNFDHTKTIEYVSKDVRSLTIDRDVTDIRNWNEVDEVTVDESSIYFSVVDNMLIDQIHGNLYMVFPDVEEAVIPKKVYRIHYRAFEYCRHLKKVVFPYTYLWEEFRPPLSGGLWFFNQNVKEPEIVIEGREATLSDNFIINKWGDPLVYFGNTDICKIPSTITSTNRFSKIFQQVDSFEIDSDHPSFSSVDGVITDKSKTKLLFYPRTRDAFMIPETISEICRDAVSDCCNLESIVIPESVNKIDQHAFLSCSNLRTVKFLNPTIECHPDAFPLCGFEPVEGVYYMGHIAYDVDFSYKGELKIRDGALVLNTLTGPGRAGMISTGDEIVNTDSLFIPSSIREINYLLAPLARIRVDEENPYYRSIDGVLFSKDMKTLIRYPEKRADKRYTVPDGVESIAALAFHNCSFLREVVLPDSINSIDKEAFSYTFLLSVELPYKTVIIGNKAFTPFVYLKHSGSKEKKREMVLRFRYRDLIIPVELLGNWGTNTDGNKLAEFIKTDNDDRKQNIYSGIKTSEYKWFMAFCLAFTQHDQNCKKYLLRNKSRLKNYHNYSELLEALERMEITEISY